MASFKNACMAFVVLAIAAHSSAGEGITINIWQDGSNVRAHSNGGTLDFNVFTNIQGPNEYFSGAGGPSQLATNGNVVGIGYGLSLTYVDGSPITRTGTFGDGAVGGKFADIASGPMLTVYSEQWGSGISTQWTSISGKVAFYDAMDSTWVGTTMSAMGFLASPPTTTYTWGSAGVNETVTVLFSAPTPSAVPEIDPATGGSALSIVAGVLAMIEQRRRRATLVA
jgi:hypothetical protein